MSYDMIDRFLRNNLGDDDYAEYSAALDSLCTPQPKQEQGEPVVIADGTFNCNAPLGTPLYAAPQQRTWIGLTSEDIYVCDDQSNLPQHELTNADLRVFAYAIDAKLKKKNT